ncbi:hypothetical protein EI555_016427 [Monodon monoceros]|uniref:Protein kinase domain-containing protein n=1 Tax=Monodon monoceros TaxID=40151 RepID=A0A4U1FEB3_MONMO|nr:hypothetical protein EI555_016427 [Monodon monoceros]
MAIDMWSLGCIMAELYTGYPPVPWGERGGAASLHHGDPKGFPKNITNNRGRKRYPDSKDLTMVLKAYDTRFLDFLRKCLVWEPSLRVTPDQALKHAWIHEPWNLKAQPRLQTLRKASLCFPSEARKGKVQGQHHLGKQGTVPQIASPISIIQGVILQIETKDKINEGATKQDQNSGSQQGSVQHTAQVQLPHLAEASRKPEAVVGPAESKASTGQQNKNCSPKNTNILPPIV